MLGDISGLERIYIVCGYTDMRKSIDGLCAVVEEQLKLDLHPVLCFCSVADAGTGSRPCTAMQMVLY